ncbi:DNA-binding transcriptional regulator [Thermostilla marina]
MPHTKHILLLVETSKIFGRGLLEGIGSYAVAHGRWSLYMEERSLGEREPDWLRRWTGDGIIIRSYYEDVIDAIVSRGVPAVDTNTRVEGHGLPLVYVDEEALARMAVEHFLERRFQRVAFCTIEEGAWVDRRRRAFAQETRRHGIPCHWFSAECQGRSLWEAQRQELAEWAQSLPKPIAVLAANDMCGMRLIDACRSVDISIPEQIAVLGVDNDPVITTLTSPPMSSIDLNTPRIGYEAAALLDRMMHGEKPPRSEILLPPRGVVARESTDVFAMADPELAEALTFIRRHACDGITVGDVVHRLALSRATLERRFRRYLNRTPKDEILRIRLEQVKKLLTRTRHPLPEVAALAGFKTASHMSVVFKREVGMSPSTYRKTAAVEEE